MKNKVIRVGFVGVPGAGKTSTARALAAFCRKHDRLKKIELIAEYARRYISKYGPIDTLADQYKIMEKQIEWEDTPSETSVDIIVTDSPVHLGWLYVMELRTETKKDVMYVNDIFKRMNKLNCPPRYDAIFHLPPIIKPVEDGVRPALHFDQDWREGSDAMIEFIFKLFPPKHHVHVKSVDLQERVDECVEHLGRIIEEK